MIHFFSVSLPNNIKSLRLTVPRLKRDYPDSVHSIIVPDESIAEFSDLGSQVRLVPESEVLTLGEFRNIFEELKDQCRFQHDYLPREKWYYQQALKLAFAIAKSMEGEFVVMWDADTIPTRRLEFFENGKSLLYGSLEEFHKPYFLTVKKLFGALPDRFLAYTTQFFSLTPEEGGVLLDRMVYERKVSRDELATRVARSMLAAVFSSHREMGYLISEQEVVGLSNQLLHGGKQRPVYYLRWGVEGWLDEKQRDFVARCGFTHVSLENPEVRWCKKQRWTRLFYLIIRSSLKQAVYGRLRILHTRLTVQEYARR